MRVLFVDVDGVLNNAQTRARFGRYTGIDPSLVSRLRQVTDATGCTVVLSSTWRLYPDFRAEVARHFDFQDRTPEIPGIDRGRGAEIQSWLNAHLMEVDDYAILDDDRDMLDGQLDHCFFTDPDVGITDALVDRLVVYLQRPLRA